MAAVPQLQQGMLQQRHGPRLLFHSIEDGVAQVGFETQADGCCLLLHGTAQFGRIHGTDELLVGLHRVLECGVRGAFAPEIGPHRDDHRHLIWQFQQASHKGPAPVLVVDQREKLLKLVYEDQPWQAGLQVGKAGGELGHRVATRGQVGQLEIWTRSPQGRHQTGQGHRRLATARGSQQRQETLCFQSFHQRVNQCLPSEKERFIVRLEGGQPGEGTTAVIGRRWLAQCQPSEAEIERFLAERDHLVESLFPLLLCLLAERTAVGAQQAAHGARVLGKGCLQDRRPLRQELLERIQAGFHFTIGQLPVHTVTEQGAPAESLVERRYSNVAGIRQLDPGLYQGSGYLTVIAQACVKAAGQGSGCGNRHPLGHGHHGWHAQFSHHALCQTSQRPLSFRFRGGAFAS